ncbi:MAG: hypothetical protein GXX10_09935 [Clostridiaceae bacterium]|nr:hypothetical protein [Clostridiaceae bacterium]
MKNKLLRFLKSQRGINTVEIVIILAVLVGLAILFRTQIVNFAKDIMDSIFKDTNVQNLSPSSVQ